MADENPTEEERYFKLAEAEFLTAVNLMGGLHADYLYELFLFYKRFSQTEKAEEVRQKIQGLENQTVEKAAEIFPNFKKDIFETEN